jgi:hypothetical protein
MAFALHCTILLFVFWSFIYQLAVDVGYGIGEDLEPLFRK